MYGRVWGRGRASDWAKTRFLNSFHRDKKEGLRRMPPRFDSLTVGFRLHDALVGDVGS